METRLIWMSLSGLLMVLVTLSGAVMLILGQERLSKIRPFLVAVATGSLLGGSLLHMAPTVIKQISVDWAMTYLLAGFLFFMVVDLILQSRAKKVASQVPMILIGDGFHNLVAGLSIGGAFLIDPAIGISTFIAAVLHEIPQEIGDFGILIDGGLSPKKALIVNLIAGLTFPIGVFMNLVYQDTSLLPVIVGLGAGNFLYLATVTLLPGTFQNTDGQGKIMIALCVFLGIGLQLLIPHPAG